MQNLVENGMLFVVVISRRPNNKEGANHYKKIISLVLILTAGANLFIPSTASSGTYCIKTHVYCDRIIFNVFQDDNIYYTSEVYAPYGFSNTIIGYKAL